MYKLILTPRTFSRLPLIITFILSIHTLSISWGAVAAPTGRNLRQSMDVFEQS